MEGMATGESDSGETQGIQTDRTVHFDHAFAEKGG